MKIVLELEVTRSPGYKVPKKSEVVAALERELVDRELTVHCVRDVEFFGTRAIVHTVKEATP